MMVNQELRCCRYVVKRVFLLYIYIYIIRIYGHKMEHRLQGGVFGGKKALKGVMSQKKRQKNVKKTMTYNFFYKKNIFFKKSLDFSK